MFFGTRFYFKFLYFLTAMTPAYLLFSLQLYVKYGIGFIQISGNKVPLMTFLILLGSIVLTWIIKKTLSIAVRREENQYLINFGDVKIIQTNGDVVSFLLGVVVPAVIFIENSLSICLLVFLGVQFVVFLLVTKSSTVFPNIMTILFNINILILDNGLYLISNVRIRENSEVLAVRVGDDSKLLNYVL
ncbi:hypothetical protein [Paenibacillus ihuae]|uniref:hypothetical protein n=1 Tax=Paenibacillus ihuae TaxID=1232431 RepID=UPI0006D54187|nr:hypothetical protein [Paenibacillus ihuae]